MRTKRQLKLDIKIHFDFSLIEKGLDKIQELLLQHASTWTQGLHTLRRPKTEIDIQNQLEFVQIIKSSCLERGETYHNLVKTFGPVKQPALCGSVELRGKNSSLSLVMNIDERKFTRAGDAWRWGNWLVLHVSGKQIETKDSIEWSKEVFADFCEQLKPVYGHVATPEEYDSKNILNEAGTIKAVGVDFSKYLPGLYWMNFLGKRYVEVIGRHRLLDVLSNATELGDGILFSMSSDPRDWQNEDYIEKENSIRRSLGRQYFFGKEYTHESTEPIITPEEVSD